MAIVIQTRMIASGDIGLAVTVTGSGPLVILMHGWPELGRSYRHQIEAIARVGYTVAVPDMRGYGGSSTPSDPARYTLDATADDMAAIAAELGFERWVAVGHDWGAFVAWRSALRFPEQVAGVFALSIPYRAGAMMSAEQRFAAEYPDRFFYMRYFQEPGLAESELERDVRASLKTIFFALSGDAPLGEWIRYRPLDAPLLEGLTPPPIGPLSFMTDAELNLYAGEFAKSGFAPSLNWYRRMDVNAAQARAYGDQIVRQPVGFLCGDREIALVMNPGALEGQRRLCPDIRLERIVPGAGHWIQQERPEDVSRALVEFLKGMQL